MPLAYDPNDYITPYDPTASIDPAKIVPGYEDDSRGKVYGTDRTAEPPAGEHELDWTEVHDVELDLDAEDEVVPTEEDEKANLVDAPEGDGE